MVTGASSGIGLATARAFARQGARLVPAGRSSDSPSQLSRVCPRSTAAMYSRSWQIEVRSDPGVEVAMIWPGSVNTPAYSQAANYAGRSGRPPPRIDPPEKVARRILWLADPPSRSVSVGVANGLTVFGFRHLPALFDVLVTPLMRAGALSREEVAPHRAPAPATAAHRPGCADTFPVGVQVQPRLPIAGGACVQGVRGVGWVGVDEGPTIGPQRVADRRRCVEPLQDAWTGAVVRLGRESRVPTPINTLLFELATARVLAAGN